MPNTHSTHKPSRWGGILVLFFLLTISVHAVADTYDVNITVPQRWAVKVDDGNYRVTLTIGNRRRSAVTTVRAENRRLMVEQLATRRGETKQVSFVVNKRTTRIDDKRTVKIKPREHGYLTWNDSLDLEFAGSPAVTAIRIERVDDVRQVFLCGNSTVTDQPTDPYTSWGQMATRWFDDSIVVCNHAESGLSARSFIASLRLDQVCSQMKRGDVVVCEFGHNDEKEHQPGDGAWYHFAYNLKVFVDRVRKAGGEIIFCTPTQRRLYEADGRTIADSHGDFVKAMRSVADREGVPVIDLNAMTKTFYETLGPDDSRRALVHYPANTFPGQDKALEDNTHFSPYGAYEVAKMVVQGLQLLHHSLTTHLLPDWTAFDPAHPDDWKAFSIPLTPDSLPSTKPDGN